MRTTTSGEATSSTIFGLPSACLLDHRSVIDVDGSSWTYKSPLLRGATPASTDAPEQEQITLSGPSWCSPDPRMGPLGGYLMTPSVDL